MACSKRLLTPVDLGGSVACKSELAVLLIVAALANRARGVSQPVSLRMTNSNKSILT